MNKRISASFIILATACLAWPQLATAEDDVLLLEPAAFAMPDLITPRAVGAELGFVHMGFDDDDDANVVNLDLHAQFQVIPGAIVYGRMPFSYVNDDGTDIEEGDLGNLTLGVLGVWNQNDLRIGGSVDIGLPTAPRTDFLAPGDEDGLAALLAAFARFDTFGRYAPDTTTYRFQGHIRKDTPVVFIQGQLGYQWHQIEDDDDELDIVRVAVAGGYKLSEQLAVIGEFTTLSLHFDGDIDDDDEELFHWLRGGIRYDMGTATIGAHLYVGMDVPAFFTEVDIFGLVVDVDARF